MASSDPCNPGFFSIVFGAVFSLALGGALAAVYLVSKPVEVVAAAVKDPDADKTYFIKGAAGGAGWQRKSAALRLPGGSAVFTESDLNGWAAQTFAPTAAKKNETTTETASWIKPGLPNFRLNGDVLQVGVVSQLAAAGVKHDLVLQARGGFNQGANGWSFAPEEMYLNALPLHKIPGVVSALLTRLKRPESTPPELDAVLARATKFGVVEGGLAVSMP